MAVKSNDKPLALIVGCGAGLGLSLAQAFIQAEYQVVGLTRSEISDKPAGLDLIISDAADSSALVGHLGAVIKKYGAPKVVVHNAAQLYIKPFMETSPADFERAWQSMVLSSVNVMQAVLPSMLEVGEGCVLVSGATASLRGGKNFSAFASAKFALRGLTQSLAREYQSQGIHIAHVILDGILDTPRSRELHSMDPQRMMSTLDVASNYLRLVEQSRSSWTHELDLRPFSESF